MLQYSRMSLNNDDKDVEMLFLLSDGNQFNCCENRLNDFKYNFVELEILHLPFYRNQYCFKNTIPINVYN